MNFCVNESALEYRTHWSLHWYCYGIFCYYIHIYYVIIDLISKKIQIDKNISLDIWIYNVEIKTVETFVKQVGLA